MINIENFWEWFNPNNNVYEFRIMNFELIKHIVKSLNIPYSVSGLYISTIEEYKSVLPYIKGKENVWLSVNPRKQAYLVSKDNKIYKSYTGKDIGVESINHIFIDIDPIEKRFENRINNLKKMYEFVKILLNDLKQQNITNVALICSGYGYQLLIKLDVPLMLPEQTWDGKNYISNTNFESYKILIKKVFFSKLFKKYGSVAKDYGCDIDKSACNIGRIFAAPGTMNIKHNKSVPRVVLNLGDGENNGLSDWLIDEIKNVKTAQVYNVNTNNKQLSSYFKLTEKTLINNELVQFILKTNNLPEGGRNNMLLFSLKCLIKDNNIDFNSSVVKHIKMLLDNKWGRNNPMNIPENRFHFSSNIPNNFCIYNSLPLLYKFYSDSKPVKPRDIAKHIYTYINYKMYPLKEDIIISGESIVERVYNLRKLLLDCDDYVKTLYSGLYYMEKKGDDINYVLTEVAPYYFTVEKI
jgi:NurA-like 5'-3' nuclease